MSAGCDHNAVRRYGLKLLPKEEARRVEQHIAVCPHCAAYLMTIGSCDHLSSPREESDVHAREAVRTLITSPEADWPRLVAVRRDSLATIAGVEAIIEACEVELDRDLNRAERISAILVDSADRLAPTLSARTLQALSWTRRATALHRVGRLLEAMTAVDRAETYAAMIPGAEYERALIGFTAADILSEKGDTDEALRRIRAAAATFLRYKDFRRHRSAREIEAAVLFARGEYVSARTLFWDLFETADANDVMVRARLAANIGHCLTAGGDHIRALEYLTEAERRFKELGIKPYSARIAWGKARVLLATGERDEAIAALSEVWTQFEILGALAEWVRVGIELVEWLLPTAAYANVRSICTAVYERAIEAGMKLQALEAISYLREAALNETLTIDRAQYVRRFIENLPALPKAEFLPPA